MYADMPRAREWTDQFEEGMKAYGINANQIHRYSDVDLNTMENTITREARDKI